MNKKNIEVEGGELLLMSDEGHYAVIPAKHRREVMDMAKEGCDDCINSYIQSLPKESDYAEDGSLYLESDPPVKKEFLDLNPDGSLPSHFKGSKENPIELDEVTVTAKRQYDYEGCVLGMCTDIARKNKKNLEDYRKLNNLYGNAWDVGNNAFKQDIDISKDYSLLKENDIVNLSRDPFKSDKEKGIPDKNQHIGYVSKIVDGIPYIKHYISNTGLKSDGKTAYGEYFEEPINDIKEKFSYKPSKAFRLDSDKEITLGKNNFKYDEGYEPNEIEKAYRDLHNDKQEIQSKLKLDDTEYDELAKIAYGIMGNESSFGRSGKILYRMTMPNIGQKYIKKTYELIKKVNTDNSYNEYINNLSKGYSSTKESTLFNISDNRDPEILKKIQRKIGVKDDGIYGSETKNAINKWNKTHPNDKIVYKSVTEKIRSSDYSDLERVNNYLYSAFKELGINPDNLEDGKNSGKAIIATLAWFKKRFPNATEEDLLKLYTGKKNITNYKKSYDKYLQNINKNPNDNKQYSTKENIYGMLSNIANKTNASLKDIKDEITTLLRDHLPLPENALALASDLMGNTKEITEKFLSADTYKKLQEIVKNNVSKGKMKLEYEDYNTSKNTYSDIGAGQSPNFIKMATDETYILKTFLGQANIIQVGKNEYEIRDTYDFNDKGKSFGIVDDLKKRGYSPYAIMRALARNYGSMDTQGSKVKIKIKLD